MTVAGGQDHAKGKIFRVSHIGDVDRNDMVAFISALESILGSLEHNFHKRSRCRQGIGNAGNGIDTVTLYSGKML